MKKIIVKHSCIEVPDYELGDCEDIEKTLSVWDGIRFEMVPKGYFYDVENRKLILPRGLDLGYLEYKLKRPIEMEYKHDDYDKVMYKLKTEPRSETQIKSISFLLGEEAFGYTKNMSQLSLNLDTGDGKTYCIIAALTFMQMKSMIITHIDSIKEQWANSFLKMTSLEENHICNISGAKVIEKLLNMDNIPYKVFLVNHATLRSYAKKHGWEIIHELFKKLKIGVKVYDEAHLEFNSTIKIDTHTNVKKTFYATANFTRAEYSESKLFEKAFKNVCKYGVETKNDKRKHIVYVAVTFNSRPSIQDKSFIKGRKGVDKNKYIDYQIRKGMIFDVLQYTIDYFNKFEGKMLILSPKIDSSNLFGKWLKEEYGDKSSIVFNSTIPDKEKAKVKDVDMISSTVKSFSTGVDVPGLRVNIVMEPYTSKITANQIAGRLREYSPTDYTFHVELIDVGFKSISDMYKRRLPVFKEKCVKMINIKYE